MPIFEYICKVCNNEFEALVQGGQKVACPSCESEKLEKKFSAFAVVNNGPALTPCQAGEVCNSCDVGEGGRCCPLN